MNLITRKCSRFPTEEIKWTVQGRTGGKVRDKHGLSDCQSPVALYVRKESVCVGVSLVKYMRCSSSYRKVSQTKKDFWGKPAWGLVGRSTPPKGPTVSWSK